MLAGRAQQDDAVNQAASAATQEAEEAHQEADPPSRAPREGQATTITTLKARLASAAVGNTRLRDGLVQQRKDASIARENTAEAR